MSRSCGNLSFLIVPGRWLFRNCTVGKNFFFFRVVLGVWPATPSHRLGPAVCSSKNVCHDYTSDNKPAVTQIPHFTSCDLTLWFPHLRNTRTILSCGTYTISLIVYEYITFYTRASSIISTWQWVHYTSWVPRIRTKRNRTINSPHKGVFYSL